MTRTIFLVVSGNDSALSAAGKLSKAKKNDDIVILEKEEMLAIRNGEVIAMVVQESVPLGKDESIETSIH